MNKDEVDRRVFSWGVEQVQAQGPDSVVGSIYREGGGGLG